MASDLHAKVYDVLAAYTGLSDMRNEHIAGRVAAALEADLSAAEAAAAQEAVERCAQWHDEQADRLRAITRPERSTFDAIENHEESAAVIRALAPPPSGELDRMIAEAEKRGYKEGWNDREGDLLNGIDRVYGAEASRDE